MLRRIALRMEQEEDDDGEEEEKEEEEEEFAVPHGVLDPQLLNYLDA